jgi:hypothetical protein
LSRKVWKSDPNAEAGIEVRDESVTMIAGTAGAPSAVRVDKSGTYIGGKVSIMSMPDQIRVGGLWVQNNPFLGMLPSTLASPIPALILNPPIQGITDLVESVAWAQGFLL